MRDIKEFQIVISCPRDVHSEKDDAKKACELVSIAKKNEGINVTSFYYVEDAVPIMAGESAQKVIDKQMPDEYDLYFGILWSRFGDPQEDLGGRTPTEHEFYNAYQRQQKTGSPIISIFFKTDKFVPSDEYEKHQGQRVCEFRKKVEELKIGLYKPFTSDSDFLKLAYDTIVRAIDNFEELTTASSVLPKAVKVSIQGEVPKLTSVYLSRKVLPQDLLSEDNSFLQYLNRDQASDFTDIVLQKRRVVLIGDAGSGKSTELARVAQYFTQSDTRLYTFHTSISHYVDSRIEEMLPAGFLDNPADKSLVILDGFDEIQDQHRLTAAKRIESFSKRFPEMRIVISCRRNFYSSPQNSLSGTLQGFDVFVLLDLDHEQAAKYERESLKAKFADFSQKIVSQRLGDLTLIPFYLKGLVQIYEETCGLPSNRAAIFHHLIEQRISADKEKFRTTFSLGNMDAHIWGLLQRLALGMELLGKNEISEDGFCKLIQEQKDRDLLSTLSFLEKKQSSASLWRFEHSNFQEYLAASALANYDMASVHRCISMPPSNIKVIPSWKNTVCFLLDLFPSNDLRNWIIKNEPELIFHSEPGRLSEDKRLELLKGVFYSYKQKNVWINRDRFSPVDLASFCNTPEACSYLLDELKDAPNDIIRGNAIRILHWMKIPSNLKGEAKQLLIDSAISDNIEDHIRCAALCALADLKYNDAETIDTVVSVLRDSEIAYVRYGLYYFLNTSQHLDEYIDVFLDGLGFVRLSHKPDVESRILNESIELYAGLKKVSTLKGLTAVFEYIAQHEEEYGYGDDKIITEALIESAVELYKKLPEIYVPALACLKSTIRGFHHHESCLLSTFFVRTKTTEFAFDACLEMTLSNNMYYSDILVQLANKNSLERLIRMYESNLASRGNVESILHVMSRSNSDLTIWFLDHLNSKTGNIFFLPEAHDAQAEDKKEKEKSLSVIFDQKQFLKEAQNLLAEIPKDPVGLDDFSNAWHARKWHQAFPPVVISTIRNMVKKEGVLKAEIIASLKGIPWNSFIVEQTYYLLRNNPCLKLSPEQSESIKCWCLDSVNGYDFRSAIKVNSDGRTSIEWRAIYLWFFYRKLELIYPESVLLDMLSFDYWGDEDLKGIEYLESVLSESKMTLRIINNLAQGIADSCVLKNHLNYCKEKKVSDAVPFAVKITIDKHADNGARHAALELLAVMPNSVELIEDALSKIHDDFCWNLIEYLYLKRTKAALAFLRKKIKTGEGDDLEIAINYLVETGELDGVEEYYKKTVELKRLLKRPWVAHHRNPFINIADKKALPTLILLLEESYNDDRREEHFETLFHFILDGLTEFALNSDEHYQMTAVAVKTFITEHSYLENVNTLHIFLERLEQRYYVNKSSHLTISEALEIMKTLEL